MKVIFPNIIGLLGGTCLRLVQCSQIMTFQHESTEDKRPTQLCSNINDLVAVQGLLRGCCLKTCFI